MIIGEHPNKIHNIVLPNLERFKKIYLPIIENNFQKYVFYDKKKGLFEQNNSSNIINEQLKNLPLNLKNKIKMISVEKYKLNKENYIEESISRGLYCNIVKEGIQIIVKKSSISQSIKGFFTAGLFKSIQYSSQKLLKMIK
jgi:translocator assembly and maintenance protein 41